MNTNETQPFKAFESVDNKERGRTCPHECTNRVCTHNTTDEERADHLRNWAAILTNLGNPDMRLMPLREDKRGPVIRDRCKLDSDEARSLLVTPEEAARRIKEDGVRGFYIYAGKESHGTEDLIFTDEDDPERWPDLHDTLRVVSGSGEGQHETWINAGWDRGANWKGEGEDIGGVRVRNTGVVVPGSIHHDSEGIYHVINDSPPAPLSPADVPPELQPAGSGSLPSEEGSHSPPGVVDEDSVERVRAAIREFYKDIHGSAWKEVTKRARDMLTDLIKGRYRRPEPGMSRDVVKRFETLDDEGEDRECRYEAETCLAGLLFGIIKRHGSREDNDEAEDLIYHYITHVCQKHPKTTEGRDRMWTYSEAYRRTTIRRAIERFDRELFRHWRRKQYDDGPSFTGEYSSVTYKTVMKAIVDLSSDAGEYPTRYEYPTRKEITFLSHQRDGHPEETYRTALSRLVNQYEEVKKADMGGESIYYLTWREDPEDAQSIHP